MDARLLLPSPRSQNQLLLKGFFTKDGHVFVPRPLPPSPGSQNRLRCKVVLIKDRHFFDRRNLPPSQDQLITSSQEGAGGWSAPPRDGCRRMLCTPSNTFSKSSWGGCCATPRGCQGDALRSLWGRSNSFLWGFRVGSGCVRGACGVRAGYVRGRPPPPGRVSILGSWTLPDSLGNQNHCFLQGIEVKIDTFVHPHTPSQ